LAPDPLKRFNKLTRSTIVAVYILILVGGMVRATGSGMGCPDWPRCFGRWVPPTSVDALPPDYKEKYAAIRDKKNVKFARYLDLLGFEDTAAKIRTDKSILVEGDFDPVKSWIEYGNRLVGVAIGFFIIAVAWRSWQLRKEFPWVFRVAVATLVAVIIQGWFGSIVVSTNLTTWTVTVHMFVALAIVLMLIFLYNRTSHQVPVRADKGVVILILAAMIVLLVQVFFGTDVRAAIDRIALSLPRSGWLDGAGVDFIRHRSFSWTVLIIYLLLFVKLRKTEGLGSLSTWLLALTLGTFLTGAGMAWMAVPAYLQPVHLLLATLTFGAASLVLFRLLPASGASISMNHE
jgi:cytochrome c oxidase assembly protein subunit 15